MGFVSTNPLPKWEKTRFFALFWFATTHALACTLVERGRELGQYTLHFFLQFHAALFQGPMRACDRHRLQRQGLPDLLHAAF